MLDDVVAFLDRSYQSLTRREKVEDLLLHLDPFLASLDREPRIRLHLDDMAREAEATQERFNQEDQGLVERLKALRAKVPRLPIDDDAADGSCEERYGLDSFDRAAEKAPPSLRDRLRNSADADDSASDKLVFRLRCRLDYAYPNVNDQGEHIVYGDDVKALYTELAEVKADADHARRRFSVQLRTSGNFALLRLRAAVRQLNPPAVFRASDEQSWLDHLTPIVGDVDLFVSLVHDSGRTARYEDDAAAKASIAATVRSLVDRVYEEVRTRIGSALSLRALLQRFKVRAESYDHEALCAIARDRKIKRKEDRLADRLAAFLFDQGLTPLTRPMISRLSPDIIAPDLYIEAKQYGDGASAKKSIRQGANQVWSTFNRLRGTPHEVREAYLVVFRRKGPCVLFEEASVRVAGATLHVMLVDVAPNTESGSRQKEKPVPIAATDLLPASLSPSASPSRSARRR